METDQLAQTYASETDDQLVQLAAEQEQLTPEARIQLLGELQRRGINPANYRPERSEAEESLGGNNLSPKDWQQYRRWTGEWPILSAIGYLVQWAVLLGGVMVLAVLGTSHFSKIEFIVVVGLWVVVGGILSDRIRRVIRLKELRSYRGRRGRIR